MSVSTAIVARPGKDATEDFSITTMNFNAKTAGLPATVELDARKLMQGDPADVATVPKPMGHYTAPDGTQYRA